MLKMRGVSMGFGFGILVHIHNTFSPFQSVSRGGEGGGERSITLDRYVLFLRFV